MMKTRSHTIRIVLLLMLGMIALSTTLAHYRTPATVQYAASGFTSGSDDPAATPQMQEDDVGSTDGIMVMAVVIVLIVIIPILLRRQAWSNGKRKENSPSK